MRNTKWFPSNVKMWGPNNIEKFYQYFVWQEIGKQQR